jgi:hypothetical protein
MAPDYAGPERRQKLEEGGIVALLGHPLVKILGFLSWALLVALFTMAYGNITAALQESSADRAEIHKIFAEREQSRAATEASLTADVQNLTYAVNRLADKLDREQARRDK